MALDLDAETKRSVGELYGEIADIFRQLDGPGGLFIGPPSAQRVTLEIVPVPLRGVTLPPDTTLYDVKLSAVTNLETAIAVIDQIVEEGEGSPKSRTASHFGRLLEVAAELKGATERDPSFEPARPVMMNPTRKEITNAGAIRIFDLFDDAYAITVLLLMRYFGQSDETAPEVAALQQAVFFPMMTAVIRPLGEILTQLPAGTDPDVRAGPSFTLPRRLAFLPHRQAAWSLFSQHLDGMAAAAERLSTDSSYPEAVQSRLVFAHQNLARIAFNFRTAMQDAPPGP
jgi:Ferritin-like